jgi:uncharacterized protein
MDERIPCFYMMRDMAATIGPVAETERHEAIDVLRGVAVLGILVMNIQSFSMPFAAYFNPTALGPPSESDFTVWFASHLLADQKFMTIFAALFGAGVLLFSERVAARGGRPASVHYRRMFWLLVFGLMHAYLLWYGDILVLYAICGMLIYPARTLAPRTLLVLGILVISVSSLLYVASGLSMDRWPPEVLAEVSAFWSPDAATLSRELAAFRGGWFEQLPLRASYSQDFHTFELWIWGVWRAGGLMLVGMALLKLRVLTGARSQSFYTRLALVGFSVGLPMIVWEVLRNVESGWTVKDGFFLNAQWNYWASLLVSLGWTGLVMRLWQSGAARAMVARLGAVGRMAFSCYIAETLIATTIFYGHGFGLFGSVDRVGQIVATVCIWTVLLVAAPIWLQRFRFGPLEWLWRTLTYGRVEPLRRATPLTVPAV